MQIGILKSKHSSLVPLVPTIAAKYQKDGYSLVLEPGGRSEAYFSDHDFEDVLISDRKKILAESDVVLVDDHLDEAEIMLMKADALLIGRFNVLSGSDYTKKLSQVTQQVFSLDLVPRSSIAQSMDVLSSLASLSGYLAVIKAADRFPGYFPMMTTAAGTVPPAKVLILGAGVAGLQAIATAKRLGASVEAFDVRSAVKEEVQSLGAKFIEVSGSTEDQGAGGYAVTQSEAYVSKQKELIHLHASKADVVITTANIPGKKAPLLIEKRTVEAMKAGSVIIDMASATGGNCELSVDGKEVDVKGVKILGDSKLFQQLPKEASRLYSTNLYNFIKFILKDGLEGIPYAHEIVQKTLITEHHLVASNNQ